MSKIQVLLSSYNGEKYIKQQLESINNQTFPNIDILVRDDGSSDQTLSQLIEYSQSHDNISIMKGTNVGVIESFIQLLNHTDEHSDYFCFCDQDDVWMQDKIEIAVNALSEYSTVPGMVFTSTQLVDADLHPIKIWPESPNRTPAFENALIENVAVGATITFNKAARDLIRSESIHADRLQMHDWWTYLCISAFGKVIYISQPSIYYRQHGNNVVGGTSTSLEKWKRKWKSYRKHSGSRLLYKQAKEFYCIYGDKLDKDKLSQLELFLAPRDTLIQRVQYLRKSQLYRQSWIDQKLFQFLVLIGYI